MKKTSPLNRRIWMNVPTSIRVVGVYLIVGCLWIFFSDRLLSYSLHDPMDKITQLQTFKGWIYVIATGAMLYWLIDRETRVSRQAAQKLKTALTELQSTQDALKYSEAQFRAFMDNSPAASWITNTGGQIEYVSQTYIEMFQVSPDLVGHSLFDLYPREIAQTYLDNIQAVAQSGRMLEVIEPGIRADGRPGQFWVYKFPLPRPDGCMGVGGVAIDVTDRKQAEAALQHSEEQLRLAFDFAQIGSWDWDLSTNQLTWNKNHFRLLGLDPAMTTATYDHWRDRVYPDDLARIEMATQEAIHTHTIYEAEYRVIHPDGSIHWLLGRGRAIYTETGQPIRMLGVIFDVTAQKYAETCLRSALSEKDVLLKEIHHRVKNNLQIVSGLLHLQAQGLEDPALINALKESQNRVESMSLIHKKLYTSSDLGQIDVADYIQSLTANLLTTYQISPGRISLKVAAAALNLSIDQAIPCGLIINELVSNALKYAFPDNRSGEINVKFCLKNTCFELIIQDNGIGMPVDLDWQNAQTLGLSLVYALATEQLEGSLLVDLNQGTQFTIEFPQAYSQQ